MKLIKASIVKKIKKPVVFTFIVIALITSLLSIYQTYSLLFNEYQTKGLAVAHTISDTLDHALVSQDISIIQDTLNQYLTIPGVDNVYIVDETKTIICHTFTPVVPSAIYTFLRQFSDQQDIYILEDASILVTWAPISQGAMGYVFVTMDLSIIYTIGLRLISQQIFAILLVSLFGLYMLSRRLYTLMSPIKTLSRITQNLYSSQFKLGVTDRQSLDAIGDSKDELSQLAMYTTTMCDQLSKHVDSITQLNSEKAALKKELSIAQHIQLSMLTDPEQLTFSDGTGCSAFLESSKDVGGDFYDVQQDDNLIYITIGDVSGKGVAAALFMSATLTAIRSSIAHCENPSDVVTQTNQYLSSHNSNMLFVTLFFGIFDTQNNTLHYVNAGHPSPLILDKADNSILELPLTNGMVLGIDSSTFYESNSVTLPAKALTLFYTDGLNEAQNQSNNLLGEEPIRKWMTQSTESASSLKAFIVKEWESFCEGREKADDCTFVVLETHKVIQDIANPFKVHFENDIEELTKLQHVIELFCQGHALDKSIQTSLNLVLEELISNTIFYGYEDHEDHLIYVTISFTNKMISIKVEDDGIAFNPIKDKPDVDLNADIDDRPIGGLGIHIVEKMVSSLSYERANVKNILTITKEIS